MTLLAPLGSPPVRVVTRPAWRLLWWLLPPLLFLGMMLFYVLLLSLSGDDEDGLDPLCDTIAGVAAIRTGSLSAEQTHNAETIIAVGRQLNVPPAGWVVALATAMQESNLHALPYGDRDSIGLFQQRTGWGLYGERINPVSSARMFYLGGHAGHPGLMSVPGWEHLPVTQAAQAVQQSAYPHAYARWEPLARHLVATLTGVAMPLCPLPEFHGPWQAPVSGALITARFGAIGGHWAHFHTGIDFAVPLGTPIHAASAGTVTWAGISGPYGLLVKIDHSGGVVAYYAHLSAVAVHPGEQVQAGQVIAASGASGNVTGPHLHFEVRRDDRPIDPEPWLAGHRADSPSSVVPVPAHPTRTPIETASPRQQPSPVPALSEQTPAP